MLFNPGNSEDWDFAKARVNSRLVLIVFFAVVRLIKSVRDLKRPGVNIYLPLFRFFDKCDTILLIAYSAL